MSRNVERMVLSGKQNLKNVRMNREPEEKNSLGPSPYMMRTNEVYLHERADKFFSRIHLLRLISRMENLPERGKSLFRKGEDK